MTTISKQQIIKTRDAMIQGVIDKLSVTQDELAKFVGVNPKSLSAWRRGSYANPGFKFCSCLLRMLLPFYKLRDATKILTCDLMMPQEIWAILDDLENPYWYAVTHRERKLLADVLTGKYSLTELRMQYSAWEMRIVYHAEIANDIFIFKGRIYRSINDIR